MVGTGDRQPIPADRVGERGPKANQAKTVDASGRFSG